MRILSYERMESRLALDASAFDVIGVPADGLTGKGYNVAVIDTGADISAAYYRGGANFIDKSEPPSDDNGHGGFVSEEIHSVAPDAGIYALKALAANGEGGWDAIDAALRWVIDNWQVDRIVAVNMSFGSPGVSDAKVADDINSLVNDGLCVVAAAGNNQCGYPNTLDFPANLSSVISVGATYSKNFGTVSEANATDNVTYTDKIAAFSQRSSTMSLLAPGIFLTEGYKTMWGTSMAAPLVTGACVIVDQAIARPTTENQVLKILQSTGKIVSDVPDGQDNVEHTGDTFSRIDIKNAVHSLTTTVEPTPTGDELFVDRLYERVLGREPDPLGLSYWLAALQNGMSRLLVGEAFWTSPEHMREYAVETLDQIYESLLERQPDAAGLSYYAGFSEDFVAEAILSSPEFYG